MLSTTSVLADVSDEEVQALREQIRILTERLDQLEQRSITAPETPPPARSLQNPRRLPPPKPTRFSMRKLTRPSPPKSMKKWRRFPGRAHSLVG